jgi:hypothetical protein
MPLFTRLTHKAFLEELLPFPGRIPSAAKLLRIYQRSGSRSFCADGLPEAIGTAGT